MNALIREEPEQRSAHAAAPVWNRFTAWVAITAYWLAAYLGTRIQSTIGAGEGDGVPVIAAIFFALVILCMATERGDWPLLKRAAFVPASLAGHAILTIPMAAALGILAYDPTHVRTVGEQRAVFILASLPILAYAMWRSRLFVRPQPASEDHFRPTEPSP